MSASKHYTLLLSLLICLPLPAQDAPKETLPTPKGWAEERIPLPPGFAPKLGYKGVEDVRFAPGMFKPDSESFFSYFIAFQVEPSTKVDTASLKKELLVYYQGLAAAVSKGRGKNIDVTQFKVTLTPTKKKQHHWTGTLEWTEPFVSFKTQKLMFEIESFAGEKRRWIVSAVSPMPKNKPIWKELHELNAKVIAKFKKK